jgi:hypothetical protein
LSWRLWHHHPEPRNMAEKKALEIDCDIWSKHDREFVFYPELAMTTNTAQCPTPPQGILITSPPMFPSVAPSLYWNFEASFTI